MRRFFVLLTGLLVVLVSAASVHAYGVQPQVVTQPDFFNQAVRLEVGGTQGDSSWMHYTFPSIDVTDYDMVGVSFEIYRSNLADVAWLQNLRWGWDVGGTSPSPTWGFQWDHWGPPHDPWTQPFNKEHATTVRGDFTNLTMEWNFDSMTAYSEYDGSGIDMAEPISGIETLSGWRISLCHEAGTGNGDYDVAWIDNFTIYAEDHVGNYDLIYYSEGFEDFTHGNLNGQDGWEAGADNPVPIPGAVWLLGSGLIAMVGIRRRKKG